MKCNNCGMENPVRSKFCGPCGVPLMLLSSMPTEIPEAGTTQFRQNIDRTTEVWEYYALFLPADVSHERELQQIFPNVRILKFDPVALIPQLNAYGKAGWELVVCHPYTIGENADVLTHNTSGAQTWTGRQFTHMYFCVFKRRKVDSLQ